MCELHNLHWLLNIPVVIKAREKKKNSNTHQIIWTSTKALEKPKERNLLKGPGRVQTFISILKASSK
jgi:hypothetical protein